MKQIHSRMVIEAPAAGGERVAEADGLVAQQPGLVVGVRTADCVPVLMVDVRLRAVAAVHAGWRGTAGDIVAAAVQELFTKYGTRPEDLYAAIGPSIGPCCYEVSPDVAGQFQEWTTVSGLKPKLDLPAINELQLRNAGVQNVHRSGVCTFCDAENYFSFRREKEQAGRMLSFIGIENR